MSDGEMLRAMRDAIISAMTHEGPAPQGTVWPAQTMDPTEAHFRANKIVESLSKAGYVIRKANLSAT